jgi:hypothetical protein
MAFHMILATGKSASHKLFYGFHILNDQAIGHPYQSMRRQSLFSMPSNTRRAIIFPADTTGCTSIVG